MFYITISMLCVCACVVLVQLLCLPGSMTSRCRNCNELYGLRTQPMGATGAAKFQRHTQFGDVYGAFA